MTDSPKNSPSTTDQQSISAGHVTGITSFGAFVKLTDGQEGLVHISEIADTYISNIGDYLTNNQEVKVKRNYTTLFLSLFLYFL